MKTDVFNENKPLNANDCMLANLKSCQSHASLKGCCLLGLLDHSSFLFLACLLVVKPRSEFDVEDIRFQKPMGQVLQHYGMYWRYKYTSGPLTAFQAKILIFSSLRRWRFPKRFQVSILGPPLETKCPIEFRNVRSQGSEVGV